MHKLQNCEEDFMRKSGIYFLTISILLIGMVAAEPGIPKVNEVQGLSTSTTVIAAGNFNGASSVDLTISSVVPITGIPGPEWTNDTLVGEEEPPANLGATIYQTVYTEDTQNSEVGFISYDKDLDVSTGNKVSGQYNVQAVKQITYLGVDASSLVTNDYMLLDGAGWPGYAGDRMICPFANGFTPIPGVTREAPYIYAAFCNRVETGSSMNLKVADLNTQMADRFIMKSADAGVSIQNNVGVGSYAADLPSKGSVSAYIRGSIREGGRLKDVDFENPPGPEDTYGPFDALYETVTFSDSTGISGDISTFAKTMSYTSVLDVSGDIPTIPEN
jgi:hypothetical protein